MSHPSDPGVDFTAASQVQGPLRDPFLPISKAVGTLRKEKIAVLSASGNSPRLPLFPLAWTLQRFVFFPRCCVWDLPLIKLYTHSPEQSGRDAEKSVTAATMIPYVFPLLSNAWVLRVTVRCSDPCLIRYRHGLQRLQLNRKMGRSDNKCRTLLKTARERRKWMSNSSKGGRVKGRHF